MEDTSPSVSSKSSPSQTTDESLGHTNYASMIVSSTRNDPSPPNHVTPTIIAPIGDNSSQQSGEAMRITAVFSRQNSERSAAAAGASTREAGLFDSIPGSPWSPYARAPPTVSSQTIRDDLHMSDDEEQESQEQRSATTMYGSSGPQAKKRKNDELIKQMRHSLDEMEKSNQRPTTVDTGTQTEPSGAPEHIFWKICEAMEHADPEVTRAILSQFLSK